MQRFEPDHLVLVREKRETVWRLTHYSHRIQGDKRWSVTIDGKVWEPHQIIPYTGNEIFSAQQIRQSRSGNRIRGNWWQ